MVSPDIETTIPEVSPALGSDSAVASIAAEPALMPAVPTPAPVPVEIRVPPAAGVFLGTGRRKTSVARIRLVRPGTGKITLNGKPLEKIYTRLVQVNHIVEPLKVTQMENLVDIEGKVEGGGVTGQAGAIRHGVARALLAFNPDLRKPLRKAGCLTRDPRAKERRKYGLKKARKAEQYSKR